MHTHKLHAITHAPKLVDTYQSVDERGARIHRMKATRVDIDAACMWSELGRLYTRLHVCACDRYIFCACEVVHTAV